MEITMQHLPIHPFTGLQAVYVDKHGRPRYPMIGASDDGAAGDGGDQGGSDNGGEDGDKGDGDKLEDGGKKALDAERTARRAAERTAKPWAKLAEEFGITPDEARELLAKAKPKDDKPAEVDPDKIRREAERQATEKANARIVRSEVRALASETFTNPADALHNLDLSDYEVNEDGELVDAAKVKSDLAAVLKDNPHYAKTGKAPKPDPSQGPRGNGKPDPGPGMARLRAAYADNTK